MSTRSLLLVLGLLLVPFSVVAHESGESYEAIVGEYQVDIGYSTSRPVVGESVQFDFGLTKNNVEVSFTDTWVRIEGPGGVVLATGIVNASYGGPRLSYVFGVPGEYTVATRYENGTATLAEATFPITVEKNEKGGLLSGTYLYLLVGLVMGVILGWFIRRLRTP